MLALERNIAYDIMGEDIERSEQEILNEEADLIEKSDITALGVAVPEVLVTEGDEGYGLMQPDRGAHMR